MKPFTFSLEKMSNYKEQILNKEKNTLAQMRAVRDAIIENIENLEQSKREKKEQLQQKTSEGMTVFELRSYEFMIENMRKQIKVLNLERIKQEELIAKQVEVVKKANMDMASLDKLETKQRESHNKEMAKKSQEEILEIVNLGLHKK